MARLFVDNLTVIDFSYLDADRGVVGESWIVDIELGGELDVQSMVFDFGSVKKQIKQFIDAEVDHRLLVPCLSSGCKVENTECALMIEFPLASGGTIKHQSPKDAVLLVETQKIDASDIAQNLQAQVKASLPSNVSDVSINLRCESINAAYYQYTHGLQKHNGQCQHIAHGHRSRIQISIDGIRQDKLEAHWAKKLKDCYIATAEHIKEECDINGITHVRMDYVAAKGPFAITLPKSALFLLPCVSTVENIAAFLANAIAMENHGEVVVKAFEGLEKGAYGKAVYTR